MIRRKTMEKDKRVGKRKKFFRETQKRPEELRQAVLWPFQCYF